jgi:phosphatidylglycerol:prolipoprotein diacylglycerol transferase
MINFPNIDPIIFSIGPFDVRWYGLSYALGILFALKYSQYISKKFKLTIEPSDLDNFLIWAMIGIVVGGRAGYVFLYTPLEFLHNPMYLFDITEGGMSFHGGLAGVIISAYAYCAKNKISFLKLCDIMGFVAPIGLFLGRIANFINGELWGRPTDVPWGVIFPGQMVARHASQIYEALTEGLLIFIIMNILLYNTNIILKKGRSSAIFLLLYAVFRSFCEMYREPDAHLGFLIFDLTMGQILSSFMVLIAIIVLYVNRNSKSY